MSEECIEAMEALTEAAAADFVPRPSSRLQKHLATCARCRQASADAMICAPGLRAARRHRSSLPDPAAWERGLFLRLLAAERAEGRRRGAWARLAGRLGRRTDEEGSWRGWPRGWAGGASRS